MDFEVYYQITKFLYHEAYLLDHRRYNEWLDLLADDLIYRMPLRLTKERKDGGEISEEMAFYEETKKSLQNRVKRLYAKSAWVEDPPPRQRHFISNITVSQGSEADEYKVLSYFSFQRSIGSSTEWETLNGEREDIIRLVNGEWKLASRVIYPDQTVLGTQNLSMFF
jgi:3-phenylpropionate/cinnamic acid dioxygenase small subunit